MDWSIINAISEMIGAIAVVISLVYLALQVRQSNIQAEASAESTWLTTWNDIILGWIADESTVDILRRGFTDFDSLSNTHKVIFQQRLAALTNQWILAIQLKEKGKLNSETFDGATNILVSVYSTPGGLELLNKVSSAFPRGNEILDFVTKNQSRVAPFTVMFPWWSSR